MVGNLSTAPKKLEKVLVVSRHDTSQIKDVLAAAGFTVVDGDPDFILCYGGDGTVLFSEMKYPTVPKLIIKTSRACRKCDYSLDELKTILSAVREGSYCLHKKLKLETEAKGRKLVGLNEIQIHPKLPTYAVRFSLSVDGEELEDLIGDGVIVATPFGSTGYYKATGGKRFSDGIGISFNNLHNRNVESFVVPEDSTVKLTVSRGPAWLLADNDEHLIELGAKDSVTIKKSGSTANFIYVSAQNLGVPTELGAGEKGLLKIGHRGARAYEPENTLSSFKRAIELGVDAVELDVRKTRDNEIVVIHNADVNKTTDGSGSVSDFTLEEIQKFVIEKGEHIPTLGEVLDFVGKRVKVLVELKETGIEEKVLDVIREKGLTENVIIISFHEEALRKVRELNDKVATGLIYVRHKNPLQSALELKAEYLLPLYRFTHSANVRKAHEKGLKVIVWTINTPEEAAEYKKKGVDGIATDRPDILNS